MMRLLSAKANADCALAFDTCPDMGDIQMRGVNVWYVML